MIRHARTTAILLLMVTANAASAAAPTDAHDLLIRQGNGPSVHLRLRIEVGGQALASRESQFLREWFAYRAGAADRALDVRTAERAIRHNPICRLVMDGGVTARQGAIRLEERVTAEELARRWMRQSSGRFLRLDAAPAKQPYGELLTRALVAALDRDHDGKLTKAELTAADKVLMEQLDADEDECVTPFELVPSLLTDVPSRKERVAPRVVLSHPGQANDTKPDREITVRLDDRHTGRVLMRTGNWIIDVGSQTTCANFAEFRYGRRPSPAADRDGDGTVTDAELGGDRALVRQAADNLVTLTISLQPRSWFEILDADGDGQLSVRELRFAWARLADAEARKTGFVTPPDGNSRYLTLTFVRGTGGARVIPLTKRPARGRGPSWFQAMDRNGDGCVSPREFIGTHEQFRRLDRDGDGLLSPEEAEAIR